VLYFLHIRSSLLTFPHFHQNLQEQTTVNRTAPNVPTTEVTKKWPLEEYYRVGRPVEEWVPPLEVLEQIQSDEPCESREAEPEHEDNEWDWRAAEGEGL
jgi:hypothetical protein